LVVTSGLPALLALSAVMGLVVVQVFLDLVGS
jgi:heme/copper-type cytochrome/quinol oxidase subunit 4